MTILVGGLSRLLGTALLGVVVPWMACAGGSEDESLHRAPTIAPRQHAPMIIRERHATSTSSSNWSGYAVTAPPNESVWDVKGSWIVPAIQGCQPGTQYSSFWVGIDGYSSNTVEQIGTDSDCQNGSPVYYAWYEFYPKFPYNINTITVKAGDKISAEVSYDGSKFTVSIADLTANESWSTSQKMPNAKRSSAEWIIEASGGEPLADFGTVGFGQGNTGVPGTCYATVAVVKMGAASAPIASFGANLFDITMIASNGAQMSYASPSPSDPNTSLIDTFISAGP